MLWIRLGVSGNLRMSLVPLFWPKMVFSGMKNAIVGFYSTKGSKILFWELGPCPKAAV